MRNARAGELSVPAAHRTGHAGGRVHDQTQRQADHKDGYPEGDQEKMTEWNVLYTKYDGEECFVVLPTFRKLLWWFLRTARQCDDIKIFVRWEKHNELYGTEGTFAVRCR